jgi:hypothetical protein
MDDGFAAAVAAWHDFYLLAGTAAATLIGLIFVALSLNPEVMADDGPVGVQAWAGQTFGSFLTVLVIALVCLIPDQNSRTLGLTLLILGGEGLVRGARRIRRVWRDPAPEPDWRTRRGLSRFVAPTAAHGIVLAVAVDVLGGEADSLDWLVVVIFLLVSGAAGAAWALLSEMGRRHFRTAPGDATDAAT